MSISPLLTDKGYLPSVEAGAPPSLSDSWDYFKTHGTLPDRSTPHCTAPEGRSPLAGAEGGACPPGAQAGRDAGAGSSALPGTAPIVKPLGTVISTSLTEPRTRRASTVTPESSRRFMTEREGSGPVPFHIMGWAKEPTRADCNEITGAAACQNHPGEKRHFKQVFRKKCERLSCPDCWDAVSRKMGKRAATRVRNFLTACQEMGPLPLGREDLHPLWQYVKKTAGTVRHVIITPEGELRQNFTFEELYAMGHRLFKALGPITAYIFCFHPYRITEEAKDLLEPYLGTRGADEEREARYWDLIHRDAANLGSWEAYVTWGPHYHGAVCGWMTREDFFNEATGWKYKNKGPRNLEVLADPHTGKLRDPLTGFFQYLASHAMVKEGRQVFRAGKLMHSRYLKGKRFKGTPEDVLCGCGANVIRFACGDGEALGDPLTWDDGAMRFYQRRRERWEVSLKCFPDNPPPWLTIPGGGEGG